MQLQLINPILKMFQFEMRLNMNKQMRELLTKDESFWIDLLNKYLIDVSISK